MRNASAVFGDYDQYVKCKNVPLGKPHYYPSEKKQMDEASKEIRLHQKYTDPPAEQNGKAGMLMDEELSRTGDPVHEISLENLMSFITGTSGSSKYNESWSNTEKHLSTNSPYANTIVANKDASKEHSIEDFLENRKINKHNESGGTLSKFVQRFREQPPLSRNERYSQKEKAEDFWWLSSPLPYNSSTPKSNTASTSTLPPNSVSFSSPGISDKSSLSSLTPSGRNSTNSKLVSDDTATARIQQRTHRLLELSENTIKGMTTSSSVPSKSMSKTIPSKYVEGASAKIGNMNEYIKSGQRYPVHDYPDKSKTDTVHLPRVPKLLKPEDDILYKWRIFHKMELAGKAVTNSSDKFLNRQKNEDVNGNIKKANKNISPEKKHDNLMDKEHNIYKIVHKNDVSTVNNREKESTDKYYSKSFTGSIADDKEKHIHPGCQKAFQHSESNSKTILERDKSCCRHPKQINTCGCPVDQTQDYCVNFSENPINCQCGRQWPLLSTYNNHIPPHVHDICDIMPCVHKGHINKLKNPASLQMSMEKTVNNRNEKIPLDDKYMPVEMLGEKHTDKNQVKYQKKKAEKVSSTQSNISPVINQVITDHLFEDNDRTLNTCTAVGDHDADIDPVITGNVHSKIPSFDISSSEDEFDDDEILQELRNRRRSNKDELLMVCEYLQRIQEERAT